MYETILKTRFIGKNINYLTSCHSTNDIAACKVRSELGENGEIFIANEQLAGRGQRGNVWESETGKNFTFSIILRPGDLEVPDRFLISQCIALGVHRYVTSVVGDSARIKWPNDILVGNQKVAGISIDNSLRGSSIVATVAGIGLNINQINFNSGRITSLALVKGRSFVLEDEFPELITCLDECYALLEAGEKDEINRLYLENLSGRDETRTFASGGESFEGIISGVSADGRLRLLVNGAEQLFDIKEIAWDWS